MQCLIAPTRAEADPHMAKLNLYLAIPSLRNLPFVGPALVIVWVLLCVSSLLLDFL
jgi:hypothetical protein